MLRQRHRHRLARVVLSAWLARKLEPLLLVGSFVVSVLAGPAPDMSATAVSVSMMLSLIPTGGAVIATVAGARSVSVDIAEAAGLAVALAFTDGEAIAV